MRKMIRCDVCHKPVEDTDIITINRTPLKTWMESNDDSPRTIYEICRPCFPVLMELMDEAYQEACGIVRNESKWAKWKHAHAKKKAPEKERDIEAVKLELTPKERGNAICAARGGRQYSDIVNDILEDREKKKSENMYQEIVEAHRRWGEVW